MSSGIKDDSGIVAGVDIGGTKTAIVIAGADTTGATLGRDRFLTECEVGPDRMLGTIYERIAATLESAGRDMSHLRAIGFAVPGQVDDEGRVIEAGKLTGWSDLDLRGRLVRDLAVPAFVEHDANAAALGEQHRGLAGRMRSFVFLALGTGLGAGIVIDGRLYRGARHAAGEVGNMVPGRAFLDFGPKGTNNLGSLIGGQAIRNQAEDLAGEPLGAAEALKRSEEDERLEPLLEKVADYVALAVINISALLDPDAIIFGGGTSSAGAALFDRVRERATGELTIRPTLLRSALGEDAQLEGAVLGARFQIDPGLRLREEDRWRTGG
jgi:glucokinase